ncbi:MAG: phosphoenolpyruvate carboxylase [Vicinamibacterales bacterium]
MLADPHKPLRDDVRLLGELLGDTVRTHQGEAVFAAVERVRALAKSARGGQAELDELARLLAALPAGTAFVVARAFAHFLNLANIAEQHHRIRRRHAYLRDPGASPQRGSCQEGFAGLLAAGVEPERLWDAVCALRIQLVLTAHPTEVARRTLIATHNRIADLLAARDRPDLTAPDAEDLLDQLRREVITAWETREVRDRRPQPLDEVRGGLLVFEESLWESVPRYLRAVDRALVATTGRPLPLTAAPIRFGSWIGGDRDGNPTVTPQVTWQACLRARRSAVKLYVREVEALIDELSMHRASAELAEAVGGAGEPYRARLGELRGRLVATHDWIDACLGETRDVPRPPAVLLDVAELRAPLELCHRSLHATGNGLIAGGRLTDLLRRVAVFGLTLAELDVRQDSSRHTETLDAVTRALGVGSYAAWSEVERLAFLTTELASPRPLVPPDLEAPPEVHDVLATLARLATIPPDSLGAYIVTMTTRASDVLAVELLQKDARLARPLRVVPLFEMADDLARAGEVVGTLLDVPWYRRRIGDRLEVMVGYSDSSKDAGRFAAGWALHKAQEAIVATCRSRGVAVTLFHGRGGTVGRGGGPTHLAIRSQPAGSIDGTLRVTEQGEMIQALFGLGGIALRTMEIYTTGTLEAWLTPAPPPRPEWRDTMERLAGDARATYRAIVFDDPAFHDYFAASTPVEELATLNLGSRPARRAAGGGLTTLRAIPWQFAWTQTRLLLGSWLGMETALERAEARGEGDRLREMYRDWPHFRSVVELIEMVLAKADPRIAAEYDRQLVPAPLHPLGADLRQRLERARRHLLAITGRGTLLEGHSALRRSIDVRNPYVDPINLVQVELLRRVRQGAPEPEAHEALRVTVNGIAAGMRNTG